MLLFIVLAGLTFLLAQGVVKVDGASMSPGIQPGSWCLVRPFGDPVPGDRVVLVLDDGRRIMKRLIAVEGELVAFAGGLLIRPEPLDDGFERRGEVRWRAAPEGSNYDRQWPARLCGQKNALGAPIRLSGLVCDPLGARVESGHIFVLSDARAGSEDSRSFGALPASAIEAVIGWCL
jgi:signal peptidase I